MKSLLTKKEIERLQLQRFRELFNGFPEGEIEETEEPDFIVYSEVGNIGIEVTDLYWEVPEGEKPRQAEESIKYRIAGRARDLHEELELPPVHVSIHFSNNHTFQKNIVEQLATRISKLVEQNLPEMNSKYEEGYEWVNRDYFPEEINRIAVYRFPEIKRAFFSAPDAGFIPDLSPRDIVRVLDNKNKKYAFYRKRCNELWLVVNINGSQLSSTFDIPEEAITERYRTPFERVFLLNSGKEIYELSVQNTLVGGIQPNS